MGYRTWKVVEENGVKRLYMDFPPADRGLGCRIKAIVSAWRLNPDIQEFSMHFQTGPYWYAKFSDIFSNPCVDRSEKESDLHTPSWRLGLTPETVKWMTEKGYRKPKTESYIDHWYYKIPQELRNKFLPYFTKLRFTDDIYTRADKVLKGLDVSKCVGVLVRDMKDYVDRKWDIPLKEYFRHVDEVNSSLKLILCCQTEETLNAFKKRYGERVIVQNEHYDLKTVLRTKEVATNMVLLSRCPVLLGHDWSTFMCVAWWIGQCKAKIIQVKKKWI